MTLQYSDYDRDILIRTVIGEAGGESPEGQQAVAHVVLNRAHDPRWPGSISGVALQPKQFSAWNAGVGGNDLVRKYNPGDEAYERAAAAVDAVLSGQSSDITGGATHYYSPAGMQDHINKGEQSNSVPSWLASEAERRGGTTVPIGGHVFTGRSAAYDPENAVPYEVAYDPNGPAMQVPEIKQPSIGEQVAGWVPPITGNEQWDKTIGGVVAEGVDMGVDAAVGSAVKALFGGGGGAPLPPAHVPPMPQQPRMPQQPIMFKIKRSKNQEQ